MNLDQKLTELKALGYDLLAEIYKTENRHTGLLQELDKVKTEINITQQELEKKIYADNLLASQTNHSNSHSSPNGHSANTFGYSNPNYLDIEH